MGTEGRLVGKVRVVDGIDIELTGRMRMFGPRQQAGSDLPGSDCRWAIDDGPALQGAR